MAVQLGSAYGEIEIGTEQAEQAIGGLAERLRGTVGNLNGALAGIGVGLGAAVAGAAVAVGGAAISMQQQYDGALDALIIGTGASGAALDAMGASVQTLAGGTAGLGVTMEQIGATMAEVNTRTGATGAELEALTGQVMDFSRLTGTDSVANVQLLTRTMGDWGVGMDGASGLLDTIFGAGQAFGIGIDGLAGKLVQFGAPLRQMGFGLEESAAMLGKWEKEGVNTELVIGSLRIAAGNFAEDNIPLRDGLNQTMEAIKGAASESEALSIAMDVFGARAGPDMAAAIREGRFELDGAIETLRGTQGALADATVGVLDFPEHFQMMMSQLGIALLPLGELLVGAIEASMPYIVQGVEMLVAAIEVATASIAQFWAQFQAALPRLVEQGNAALADATTMYAAFRDAVAQALAGVMAAWEMLMGLLAPALARVGAAFAGMPEQIGPLQSAFDGLVGAVGAVLVALQPILEALGTVIGVVFAGVAVVAVNNFASVMQAVIPAVTIIIQQLSVMLNLLATVVTNVVTLVVALFTGDWQTAFTSAQNIGEAFATAFSATMENLGALVSVVATAIYNTIVNSLRDMGVDVEDILTRLQSFWDGVWVLLRGPVDAVTQAIGGLRSGLDGFVAWVSGLSIPNPFAGWEMPSMPSMPNPLGWGENAQGTEYWRGGLTWVGESGPELIDLPRGTRIHDAQDSQRMAASGGGLTINVPVQTANNSLDLVELAHRVAGVITQGGLAGAW